MATTAIIQVVPHFGGVETITSPGRSSKSDHLDESVLTPE
ncbi:MAG: hypothetical protein ACI9SC_002530 [Gammaproteobacteria bacterium]|jgi:hypothetical protein